MAEMEQQAVTEICDGDRKGVLSATLEVSADTDSHPLSILGYALMLGHRSGRSEHSLLWSRLPPLNRCNIVKTRYTIKKDGLADTSVSQKAFLDRLKSSYILAKREIALGLDREKVFSPVIWMETQQESFKVVESTQTNRTNFGSC
jgi:hypothetical protein